MTELSRAALTAYKARLPEFTVADKPTDWAAARELDRKILQVIFFMQRRLEPDQVLTLQIDTSAAKDEWVEAENKFAEVVGDEPAEFKRRLKEKVDAGIVTIEDLEDKNEIPDKIKLIIPADLYPDEDLGINTSASRRALFAGEIKQFLEVETMRATWLSVNIIGHFPGEDLFIHPSIIEDIGIEQLDTEVNPRSMVSFKVASK